MAETYSLAASPILSSDSVTSPLSAEPSFLKTLELKLKSLNRALQVSEARYRKLLDCSPNAILVGRNGVIDLANKAAVELLGAASAEQLIGASILGFVCPEDWAKVAGLLQQAYAYEMNVPLLHVRICRCDGVPMDVEASLSSFLENGEMVVEGVFRDITRRKKWEAGNTELIRGIEQVAESIVITALDGSINYVNPAFERVTGYKRAEVIGRNPRFLQSGQHSASFYEGMWETLKRGETWSGELVNKRKDGTLFNEVATISPIKDQYRTITSFVAVKRDITQELLLRKQLNHAQRLDAIGQLTSGVAHDFNNLLSVILGNIELLQQAMHDNPAALDRLQTAQHAAHRGTDLTKRLLAFAGGVELRPAPTDLHASINNTIKLARTVGPDVEIIVRFHDEMPRLLVDAPSLENALLNLIVNSSDAMPNGGAITISTMRCSAEEKQALVATGELKEGAYGCISVSDTGHGMSKETLERAFEPFYTTKAPGKGTGLGLAMVYGFVKQTGGTLRVSSVVGVGTTVTFYLPLAEHSTLSEAVAPFRFAVPAPTQARGKVLMVDDEPMLLELGARHLKRMGFTVLSAGNGVNALKVVEQHGDITLLITDVLMPGEINGIELAQKIRESVPQLRVIYSSGYAANSMASRGVPMLNSPFLLKPYMRADFEAVIHSALQ